MKLLLIRYGINFSEDNFIRHHTRASGSRIPFAIGNNSVGGRNLDLFLSSSTSKHNRCWPNLMGCWRLGLRRSGRMKGWTFISLQIKEFRIMGLSINDSVYSSVFFFLTGLHFFHLVVGLLLLSLLSWSCSFSTA